MSSAKMSIYSRPSPAGSLSCQAGVRWRQLPFIDIVDIPRYCMIVDTVDIPNRYLDIVTDGERGPTTASLVPGPAMSMIASNR